MSFTTFTNIITIIFCLAVLVQSVRMMRSLKDVREGELDRTVVALDTATAQARAVLSELKHTLSTEGGACVKSLTEAKEIREELNMMVGIANAMAERLVEVSTPSVRASQPRERAQKASATTSKRSNAKRPATTAAKTKKAPTKRTKPASETEKESKRKAAQSRAAGKAQRHLKVVDSVEEAA